MTAPKPNGIVELHGRKYKTVALRVQEFREKHLLSEGWGLVTKPIEINAEIVIFRAVIIDPQGREIAVGYAEETRTNRGINATSALENCETSALGRALAAAGFGGSEYASADELVGALKQQQRNQERPAANTPPKNDATPQPHKSWSEDRPRFAEELRARNLTYKTVLAYCIRHKWDEPTTWTTTDRTQFFVDIDKGAFKDLFDPVAHAAAQKAG